MLAIRTVRHMLLLATFIASTIALSTNTSAHADAASVNASKVKLAEGHFKRGVELFNEGNGDAAMVEFSRAYELAPRFPILYNMAQVAYELNDYAETVAYFERYLKEGGTNVPEDRRASVIEEVERLRVRIGRVHVVSDVAGNVTIDDVPVGKTPLPPLSVNMGRRKISVSTSDGRAVTRLVQVAAGETMVAKFSLRGLAPAASPAFAIEPNRATPVARNDESSGTAVAWVLTGGLAAGAAVVGAVALQRSRDLEDLRQTYPLASSAPLAEKENSVRRLAFVADGLLAGAVLAGSVALVMTLSSPSQGPRTASQTPSKVSLAPTFGLGSVGLHGRF